MFQIARPLEKTQFNLCFENGQQNDVLDALKQFQNKDGGFGHGIEPDFHLPNSTPMATSFALQILDYLPENQEKLLMIHKAMKYLLGTFSYDRKGWYAIIEESNNFPHAPWWDWDPEVKQSLIDNHWGNPNAELFGYFWKYKEFYPKWEINPMIEETIRKFEKISSYKSEHEVFCYIRLYHKLPVIFKDQLKPLITEAIKQVIVFDSKEWIKYVPKPLDFIFHSESPTWEIPDHAIRENLEFIIDQLTRNHMISPNWEWGSYPNHWALAKKAWTGVLTLRCLRLLKLFGILT